MQGAQLNALCQPRRVEWEEGLRGRGYIYIYGLCVLLFSRNEHNIVSNYPAIQINFKNATLIIFSL